MPQRAARSLALVTFFFPSTQYRRSHSRPEARSHPSFAHLIEAWWLELREALLAVCRNYGAGAGAVRAMQLRLAQRFEARAACWPGVSPGCERGNGVARRRFFPGQIGNVVPALWPRPRGASLQPSGVCQQGQGQSSSGALVGP